MEATDDSETSVLNQLTSSNNPEDGRIQIASVPIQVLESSISAFPQQHV